MSELDLGVDREETGAGRGRRIPWDGIGLMVLGAAIAIGGTVGGMLMSFARIEAEPAPRPDEIAVGVHIVFWSSIVGGIVGLLGLSLILFASWCSRRSRPHES